MTPPQTLVLPDHGEWRVRVVPNLYPALDRQEVVIHSPRHVRSIADLEDEEIELVAEAWRRRAAAEPGYVFPLLNEGREAGASLPHSHSQLVWLPDPPPAHPLPRGEMVLESSGLVVLCPWASRVPYEIVIAPVQPEGAALAGALLPEALRLLVQMVRRLHAVEGPVPLNAWLEQGGADWHLVLFPRLTVLAGLELGAQLFVNTLSPEEAAARLREGGD
jgi:UDPglucose--hexose-1-phosphate uridylyltransferase